MQTQGLKVKTVPVGDLKFDPDNARHHGERNLETIKGSLTKFGQVEPLVVQKATGIVIGGNGRLEAMMAMGLTTVQIVEVDLDSTQAKALGLALNRTGELATWDDDALARTLRTLKDADFNLDSIGWDDAQLEAFLRDAPPDGAGGKPLDEGVGGDVKMTSCPNCGHEFPR